ncbi:YibE/F family protein [Candidatus Poribacteria bacterium]|jgi:uncharacterized membrane protein|nr:YibE/F family protein [Candidatus Poribacteria bacterium]MBT5531511.1 YibE/F family protein [Candidatus Poribacteria bacterium]MBT7099579.1 YibE/F family protein [Candidatus Poribacteria bacterium]
MSERLMYRWRVKLALSGIVLLVFIGLDRWAAGYATVIQEGALTRVIAVGEVVDVNSGDVVYLRDGTTRVGRITEWDMYGSLTFHDSGGGTFELTKGPRPEDVVRTLEQQDQVLTMRVLTWPKSLRAEGHLDFRGAEIVVGNRFQGRFVDRVLRLGDRLYMDIPMKRTDRIDRVELREYFRNPFLIRLVGALAVALMLVGGVKGLLTMAATIASLAMLFGVLVPGLLGSVAEAARNGAWIVAAVAILGGMAWVVARLFESDSRQRIRQAAKTHWYGAPAWVVGGVAAGGATWACIRLIGQQPLPLALFVSLVVTVITFAVITGPGPKVVSGSLGTVGGLLACGIISYAASRILWFTGLAVELGYLDLGAMLWRTPEARPWPFVEFLTAGLVIAALGAMMDVSMSVSSTIYEVKRANPSISPVDAMKAGYNVGKDIMSTMTDTLIFAFIGADLVFIVMPGLAFQEAGRLYPFVRVLNDEATSVEAIHALMGTLGLVLAIPISAFIAGLLTAKFSVRQAYANDGSEGRDA